MSDFVMQKLRIGFFGDGPWASRSIGRIIENKNFEIVFITPRYLAEDNSLRIWANRLGVPFIVSEDVNSLSFHSQIIKLKPDILVSMSFDQILQSPILQIARFGFINCHAGALPFYRGRNPLNWALINGESQFGVTVHKIDEGIDTGPIIVQKFFPISDVDTYASLLTRAHKLCADTLIEALSIIDTGQVNLIAQDEISTQHTYFSYRRAGDEWIDWSWSSERIHNLIRGITIPGPCARTIYGETIIAVVSSSIVFDIPTYLGSHGEVIGRGDRGILVKTGDSAILIGQIAKVLPSNILDVVEAANFPVGFRFGFNLNDEVITLRKRIAELESLIKKGNHID